MKSLEPLHSTQCGTPSAADLRKHAKSLIEQLQNNDYRKATELIHGMIEGRSHALASSNGCGLLSHSDANSGTDSYEATETLRRVIQMTQDAADKTLDRAEASTPIATDLEQEAHDLRQEWLRLKKREMTAEEFGELYWRLDDFLDQTTRAASLLNSNLKKIVLEQSYQDLSGQLLGKVIACIADADLNRQQTLSDAAGETNGTGSAGKDRQTDGGKPGVRQRTEADLGQDDVDDLLSSLGL